MLRLLPLLLDSGMLLLQLQQLLRRQGQLKLQLLPVISVDRGPLLLQLLRLRLMLLLLLLPLRLQGREGAGDAETVL